MHTTDPINIPKDQYKDILDVISLQNSPVGIDAQYTHAIVITYLQQISARLEKLETIVQSKEKS